jgi:hypothetical protein
MGGPNDLVPLPAVVDELVDELGPFGALCIQTAQPLKG